MRGKTFFLCMAAILLIHCGKETRESSSKTEIIDGVRHVFNTGEPIEGKVSLEVSEVLRIDPSQIDPGNPPLFEKAVKDDSGNLYLADTRNIRVYKFDSGGKSVAQFLRKGQGPGEFPLFSDLQIVDEHIWVIGVWPLKIAQFTSDGQFVSEWIFRTFQNFYLRTRVISEDRFLTVSYRDRGESPEDRPRISTLMNASEEFLTQYYEDGDAGIFRIRTGQQQGPAIVSTNPLIAADIHHAYDRESGTVYVGSNREYVIQAKNLDGTTRMVVHNAYEKIQLDDHSKDIVLQLAAPRIPQDVKPSAKEQLPDTLNAIWGMAVLPAGHLAVQRITGVESVEIDLFDREGRLLYTIVPSAEIPDLRAVTVFKGTMGVIFEREEGNIYVEYRVKKPEEIFHR